MKLKSQKRPKAFLWIIWLVIVILFIMIFASLSDLQSQLDKFESNSVSPSRLSDILDAHESRLDSLEAADSTHDRNIKMLECEMDAALKHETALERLIASTPCIISN